MPVDCGFTAMPPRNLKCEPIRARYAAEIDAARRAPASLIR
jgi:hypothetical protein